MIRNVPCMPPDESLETVAESLAEDGIPAAAVVDARGRPLGIISRIELLRALHGREQDLPVHQGGPVQKATGRGAPEAERADRLRGPLARDAMRPISFCLGEEASVPQAAALMAFDSMQAIPIVDGNGRAVGLLSAQEVMRWLARREGYLIP